MSRGLAPGKMDMNIGLVGIPGCGKSTVAAWRALEVRRTTPCYILAHDPEHAIPPRLPDGRSTELVRHDSAAAAANAIKVEGRAGGIHAIACADAMEVVDLGQRLGVQSLAAARGGPAPPVVVLIDEVSNCEEMQPRSLGPTLKAALTMRRHRHCGLIWLLQSPMLAHQQFLSKTTELYVFRLNADLDIQHLVRFAGFPPESAAQIKTLNRYEFLRHIPAGFTDASAPLGGREPNPGENA